MSSPSDHLEAEHVNLSIGKATDDPRPRNIRPGLWSFFAVHQPPIGGSPLPNRLLIYRLTDAEGEHILVIVNAITPDVDADQPFRAIRELSAELDAPVRYVINPGPEHHMALTHFATAFPEAQILVAAGRIERENPELIAMPNVGTMGTGDALPELAAMGLHVHVWDGIMEGKLINLVQFRWGACRGTAEPTFFFHEESGTLLNGGHGWLYWGNDSALPWLGRKLFGMKQHELVWSPYHYKVWDEARCSASAKRVMEWPIQELMDLHAPLDDWMTEGAAEAVRELCAPMVEGRWDDLPFNREPLQIPEGKVTGGDWKSYR